MGNLEGRPAAAKLSKGKAHLKSHARQLQIRLAVDVPVPVEI